MESNSLAAIPSGFVQLVSIPRAARPAFWATFFLARRIETLTQVTQLRTISVFFERQIARKSLRDGGRITRRRCSEDLLARKGGFLQSCFYENVTTSKSTFTDAGIQLNVVKTHPQKRT